MLSYLKDGNQLPASSDMPDSDQAASSKKRRPRDPVKHDPPPCGLEMQNVSSRTTPHRSMNAWD